MPLSAATIGTFPASIGLRQLALVASYLREPELKINEIRSYHQRLRKDHNALRWFVSRLHQNISKDGSLPPDDSGYNKKLLDRYHLMYGVMMSIHAVINALLRTLHPEDALLLLEARAITIDILDLSRATWRCGPFGAISAPLYLIAAWCTTPDLDWQMEVEQHLAEQQHGFANAQWIDYAKCSMAVLERLKQKLLSNRHLHYQAYDEFL